MRYILIVFSFLFVQKSYSQNSQYLFLSVQPGLNHRIMFPENEKFKDSFKKNDKFHQSLSFNIYKPISLSQRSTLLIGLQYQNMGFKRMKDDVKFLDTIHPLLGIRADQVQIGPSWVEFRYRYHYLSIPFLYSKELKRRVKGASGSLHVLAGGAISGLLKQDINAVFYGFTFKGQKSIKFNENDISSGLVSGNIQIGLRYENKIDGEKLSVFVQPKLTLPVLPANYGKNMHMLYSIGAEFGLKVRLSDD
ncbi:MAG: hypothetical protein Q8K70_01295 [Bacteroidota bacterium]|nr:hypothetical protein [Bacteroidota bacterium]